MSGSGTENPFSPVSPPFMIYLDSAATTPILPEVWEAMRPFLTDTFGNPASAHQAGRQARRALEDAREKIAALLDAFPDEVIFTSGATEANNLALFGLAGQSPAVLATSPVEHPCVVEPLRELEKRGCTLAWLPVDAVRIAEARLACVQLGNHETGALQPVQQLAACVPLFHCDAAQAVGKIPVRFHDLGVTTLSVSAHKFHGPKGIGALLCSRCAELQPLLHGGGQQKARRPGTEPVALVVGLAAALELACRDQPQRFEQVRQLRAAFLKEICETASPVVVNSPESGLPHILNVSFPGVKADALLMALDLAGVCCSTGSACSSGSLLPSPVLQAMGVSEDVLRSAMRFSFSQLLSLGEVEEAARRVGTVLRRLRTLGVHDNEEWPG